MNDTQNPTEITKNKKPTTNIGIYIVILLILGAIAFVAYQNIQLHKKINTLANNLQTLQSDTAQQLMQQKNLPWQIPEINYIVTLANTNLIHGEVITAQKLLQFAIEQTSLLPGDKFTDLKSALNDDLAKLKNFQPVDTKGIMTKLDEINKQIIELPQIAESLPKPDNLQKDYSEKNFWQATLKHLQNIIIIRRKNYTPLRPIMAKIYLNQNLKLILLQTKWALLNKQQDIYLNSLQNLSQEIYISYAISPKMREILNEIEDLRKINITPTIPDISASLSITQNYLDPYMLGDDTRRN